MRVSKSNINNIEIITGQNDQIRFDIAPAAGGKITSIYNKELQKEFLWSNKNLPLTIHQPGTDYDSHFWGGIDELIPNDMEEKIDGIDYPDHGELWTTALAYELANEKITVYGKLKLSGLNYTKTISLEAYAPIIVMEYTIKNEGDARRHFLWKLHAALGITAGDKLVSSARKARVADLCYSRFTTLAEFKWPLIEDSDASIVPPKNNTLDFFYLYDIQQAEMQLLMGNENYLFSYVYDKKVFPYQWYFASYGKFLNHYMAILEPCTNMPISVNEACMMNQCAVLEPGEQINTVVHIYAGKIIN